MVAACFRRFLVLQGALRKRVWCDGLMSFCNGVFAPCGEIGQSGNGSPRIRLTRPALLLIINTVHGSEHLLYFQCFGSVYFRTFTSTYNKIAVSLFRLYSGLRVVRNCIKQKGRENVSMFHNIMELLVGFIRMSNVSPPKNWFAVA